MPPKHFEVLQKGHFILILTHSIKMWANIGRLPLEVLELLTQEKNIKTNGNR